MGRRVSPRPSLLPELRIRAVRANRLPPLQRMSRQIFRSDVLIGSRSGIPAWFVLKPGIVRALLRLVLLGLLAGYACVGGWFCGCGSLSSQALPGCAWGPAA